MENVKRNTFGPTGHAKGDVKQCYGGKGITPQVQTDYRDAGQMNDGDRKTEELRRQIREEEERVRRDKERRKHDAQDVRDDDQQIEYDEAHLEQLKAQLRAAESRRK